MKIKDSLWEEGNLSNTSHSSVSDKIGFASAATTTFQISGKLFFFLKGLIWILSGL